MKYYEPIILNRAVFGFSRKSDPKSPKKRNMTYTKLLLILFMPLLMLLLLLPNALAEHNVARLGRGSRIGAASAGGLGVRPWRAQQRHTIPGNAAVPGNDELAAHRARETRRLNVEAYRAHAARRHELRPALRSAFAVLVRRTERTLALGATYTHESEESDESSFHGDADNVAGGARKRAVRGKAKDGKKNKDKDKQKQKAKAKDDSAPAKSKDGKQAKEAQRLAQHMAEQAAAAAVSDSPSRSNRDDDKSYSQSYQEQQQQQSGDKDGSQDANPLANIGAVAGRYDDAAAKAVLAGLGFGDDVGDDVDAEKDKSPERRPSSEKSARSNTVPDVNTDDESDIDEESASDDENNINNNNNNNNNNNFQGGWTPPPNGRYVQLRANGWPLGSQLEALGSAMLLALLEERTMLAFAPVVRLFETPLDRVDWSERHKAFYLPHDASLSLLSYQPSSESDFQTILGCNSSEAKADHLLDGERLTIVPGNVLRLNTNAFVGPVLLRNPQARPLLEEWFGKDPTSDEMLGYFYLFFVFGFLFCFCFCIFFCFCNWNENKMKFTFFCFLFLFLFFQKKYCRTLLSLMLQTPVPRVAERIARFEDAYMRRNNTGMHLRLPRTDIPHPDHVEDLAVRVARCVDKVLVPRAQEAGTKLNFFVTSLYDDAKQLLLRAFGKDHIVVHHSRQQEAAQVAQEQRDAQRGQNPLLRPGANRATPHPKQALSAAEALEQAVVEWVLLARCDDLVLSYNTPFARTAAAMAHVRQPLLVHSDSLECERPSAAHLLVEPHFLVHDDAVKCAKPDD